MKNICVFCSASDVDEKYGKETELLGFMLAKAGYNLVWGGSEKGLMKIIADSVQSNGGKLFGVSTRLFEKVARKNADEMLITDTISERKKMLMDRADAIVLLVGGMGSLDEVAEIIEMKKLHLHEKPIIILNSYNFYSGLKEQLQRMARDRFIPEPLEDIVLFAEDPQQVIAYLREKSI